MYDMNKKIEKGYDGLKDAMILEARELEKVVEKGFKEMVKSWENHHKKTIDENNRIYAVAIESSSWSLGGKDLYSYTEELSKLDWSDKNFIEKIEKSQESKHFVSNKRVLIAFIKALHEFLGNSPHKSIEAKIGNFREFQNELVELSHNPKNKWFGEFTTLAFSKELAILKKFYPINFCGNELVPIGGRVSRIMEEYLGVKGEQNIQKFHQRLSKKWNENVFMINSGIWMFEESP